VEISTGHLLRSRLPEPAEVAFTVMLTHRAECRAVTSEAPDFVDLTDDIQNAVSSSAITHGRVTVFAPDAACAILINERESGLLQDIKGALARLSARSDNGKAVVGSSSVVVPVVDGKVSLGTWQRVLLVELGAPSERNVAIQIVGETGDVSG
jgi:secondary thiamine-phosphate synthase enzyme